MPRDLVVGNGNLLICLDNTLHLRDLYYPHVGELNHILGHYHRLGLWIEGQFSWLSYSDWTITPGYRQDSLVTESTAVNKLLGITLTVNDTVMPDKDIYLRRILVEDTSGNSKTREIRLFICQDYYLYETDIGDTAFYDPHSQGIVHYKRRIYLLSSGQINGKTGPTDYSCGTKKFHGAEGTWKDAEDGALSKNPIAQGSVDSAMGFHASLSVEHPVTLDYWIIAGETLKAVREGHQLLLATGCESLFSQTENYWRNWVVSRVHLNLGVLPPNVSHLFKRSLLTVRTQADNDGAITAANDTDYFSFARDTYSYMWPRDGAFVAYALDLTGHQDLTRRFFRFCHKIFLEGLEPNLDIRREQRGFFYHKYTPGGAVGSSWHSWINPDDETILPIQEDETALILWSLWHHYQQYRDIEFVRNMYDDMIMPAANFLCHYRDEDTGLPLPSYDLWEERLGIHTFTVAAVYGGLQAAANFAAVFGDQENTVKYRETARQIQDAALKHLWCEEGFFYRQLDQDKKTGKLVGDKTIGSSTFALFFFEVLSADDPKMVQNMACLRDRLWVKTSIGGMARYVNDYYHQISHETNQVPGNPWIVCTMWLAQWYIAVAHQKEDLAPALELLEWVSGVALPSGLLPEQINPYTGEAISVAPLTWSHAAYVTAVTDYLEKYKQLTKRERLQEAASSHLEPSSSLLSLALTSQGDLS